MGRNHKKTVDYFPHFVTHGKTLFIIESKYGNNGYACWFKILELLGDSDGHYYDCRNSYNWEFLLSKTHLESDLCIHILDTLANLDAIDPEMWQKRVIWSQNFVNNLEKIYNRRSLEKPKKPTLCIQESNSDAFMSTEMPLDDIYVNKKHQSKVKESIVNKSIEENRKDSVGPEDPPPPPQQDKFSPKDLIESWNEFFKDEPAILKRPISTESKSRVEKSQIRIREHPDKQWWIGIFEEINKTPFCKGQNPRHWKVTFDWLVENDKNALKVLEGNYDNDIQQGNFAAMRRKRKEAQDARG